MKAKEKPILEFMKGQKQFCVPIFQRRYSWEQKNCNQLWKSVLDAGEDDKREQHFLGSIVYMAREVQNMGSMPKYTVIDGQQRLTTLSLLILALSRTINEDTDIDKTPQELSNDYLFNEGKTGELRLKLLLTKSDNETFDYLLKTMEFLPDNPSRFLVENYQFFEKMLKDVTKGNVKDDSNNPRDVSLKTVYTGLKKLMIVDIVLEGNENHPQKIFESLNSTGKDLTEADKIRNYVLLHQEPQVQDRLYKDYWFPMEQYFGKKEYTKRFDSFIRDYITLKTERIPARRGIYDKFKAYLPDYLFKNPENAEKIVKEIRRYGRHYVDITQKEEDTELLECLEDIWALRAEVVYPFLLEVYDYYKREDLEKSEVIETLRLVESYVFRRSICELSDKFLNHIFVSILKEMSKDNANNYIMSLNATLLGMPFHRRCPKDDDFKEALLEKDIYTAQSGRICKYILRKLENYGHKEPINVDDYTIEHVMPQTKNLDPVWRQELGGNFSEIHDTYLHTIGNLTLTGYNSEYSDRPFKEKRDMEKGFCQSHLYLNESLARAEQWNLSAILARARELAEKACKIWIYPEGDKDRNFNSDNLSIEQTYNTPSAAQKLSVMMDNEEVIDHHNTQNTFVEVIVKLGPEKVMNVHSRTVSTEPFPNGRQRQHGEFYININHGVVEKQRVLEKIAEALGVSMHIEIVKK